MTQYLFKLCTCRTNSAPASEGDKQTKTYKHHIFSPTAGACCSIFPKLCMVIEDVETILKGGNHFLIQRIVFFYRVHRKFLGK